MTFRLLHDVPPEELRRVISIARRRTFRRGEVVFHEGDPADALHLVVKGRFAVELRTPLGDSALIAVRGPGDAIGEMALVGGAEPVRSATVSALEPAETHAVVRREFDALRRAYPAVNGVLVGLLAAEVRRLSSLLAEAFYVGADRRLRRRLLDLAAVYGNGDTVVVPLTQEQLAALAGTSRATANAVLRDEAARGTLALARGRVTVLDRDALARRAR